MKPIVLLLILSALFGCGERGRYESTDVSPIQVGLHLIPESKFGTDPLLVAASRYGAVTVGGSVELWAVLHVDGRVLTQVEADAESLLGYPLWEVEGNFIGDYSLRYKFNKAGMDTVRFSAIDALGDTLRDSMILYIDAPLQLQALSPSPATLDLTPDDSLGVYFQWQLDGVDSWEDPWVALYLSADSSSLLSQTPWISSTNSMRIRLESICPPDSNCRLWWKLVAATSTYSPGAPTRSDSTNTFILQTRRTDTDMAKAILGLHTPELQISSSTWVKSHRLGDSVEKEWEIDSATGTASSPFLEPGIWVLTGGDSYFPEYRADSMLLTLGPGELHNLDEFFSIEDHIAPQAYLQSPLNQTVKVVNDSLWFHIQDFGSGVDTSSIEASWPGSTPKRVGDRILFRWNSLTSQDLAGYIRIQSSDNSGNKSARCSWRLQGLPNFAAKVTGPNCTVVTPVTGDSL